MFLGYLLLAFPTRMAPAFGLVIAALAVIALGTGLFKGNLQALVGNLYDDPKYSPLRDRAFNIFYMGINIGAMFAPTASEKVSNWILSASHYFYDARIPALANDFLKGKLADARRYLSIAQAQDRGVTLETLKTFSESYINALSKSYHYGFGVACISLDPFHAHFLGLPEALRARRPDGKTEGEVRGAAKSQVVELTPQQTKERLLALGLVFFVVIFFWMAFQQSAVTMTFFARDYTVPSVGKSPTSGSTSSGFCRSSWRSSAWSSCSGKGRRSMGRAHRRGDVRGLRGRWPSCGISGYARRQSFHPPEIPALQPLLHRRPDALIVGSVRLPQQERKGAVRPAEDRLRHADHGPLLHYSRHRFARPPQPESARRPGRARRVPGLGLLADLDLFPADDCRALPQPDRDLVRIQGRPAEV